MGHKDTSAGTGWPGILANCRWRNRWPQAQACPVLGQWFVEDLDFGFVLHGLGSVVELLLLNSEECKKICAHAISSLPAVAAGL